MSTAAALRHPPLARSQEGHAALLADRAYVRLRDEIITAEIPPGSLLNELAAMKRLRIGRTPLREAIQRLRRDGFVTVIPRRGTLVTEINITDLAAVYEVRTHLESWEAGLAAERATAADRVEAARLMNELKALTEHDGFEALLSLDRRVHRFVYGCAKNPFLAETIDQYHNLSLRILYVAMARYPSLAPRLHDVVEGQVNLLRAIIQGDSAGAAEVARAHVLNFEAEYRSAIAPSSAKAFSPRLSRPEGATNAPHHASRRHRD